MHADGNGAISALADLLRVQPGGDYRDKPYKIL